MLVFGHFRHHRVLLEKLQWCLLMEPSSRGSTQANFLDDFKKKIHGFNADHHSDTANV